jgi:hypothetical protein
VFIGAPSVANVPSGLLKVNRHDHVQKVWSALEQSWAVGGGQLERDLVGVNDAQCFGEELRVEADLDITALEFAWEIDLGLAGLGAAAGELQAGLSEGQANAFARLGGVQGRAADGL